MELSPAVDVPVTVNTVWTGPDGLCINNVTIAQPVVRRLTTYTSTTMVSSFGRGQSGNYTCTATVNTISPFISDSSLSSIKQITTGKDSSYIVKSLSITSLTMVVKKKYVQEFIFLSMDMSS